MRRTKSFLEDPSQRRRLRPIVLVRSGLVLAGLSVITLAVPFPCRLNGSAIVEPANGQSVYVSVPGRRVDAVEVMSHVRQGDTLVRLENLDLQREVEALAAEVKQQTIRLQTLQSLRVEHTDTSTQIPAVRETLAELENRLASQRRDYEQLNVRTTRDGILYPPRVVKPTSSDDQRLLHWTGTPLDRENHLGWFERGTLIGIVGDPDQFEVVVFVPQPDLSLIHVDQTVTVRLRSQAELLHGRVKEVGRTPIDQIPPELGASRRIAHRADDSGILRPIENHFAVRVMLQLPCPNLVPGTVGRAKIEVADQTVANRMMRFLRQTFKAPLVD